MTCPGCPCSLAVLAELADIKAKLDRLLPPPQPEPEPDPDAVLLAAIERATRGRWVTAREVMDEATGDPILAATLEDARIGSAKSLGKRLAQLGVENSGADHGSKQWRIVRFAAG